MDSSLLLSVPLFFLVAFLYSSVGHAGASGYLAVMALLSMAPDQMRPTALILNIAVASVASTQYLRAGCFDRKVFLLFALPAVPLAFLGAWVKLPGHGLRAALGVVLVISALLMVFRAFIRPPSQTKAPPTPAALAAGAVIGFASGLTGVGGGIFLSPLLLFFGWAPARQASGIAALFILANSAAGLLGQWKHGIPLSRGLFVWLAAVLVGGALGSRLGSEVLHRAAILAALTAVLLIAGAKMLFLS